MTVAGRLMTTECWLRTRMPNSRPSLSLEAQIAEVEQKRAWRLRAEHFVGPPEHLRVDRRPLGQVRGVDERVEVARVDADVSGVESRIERLGAAEYLHLPLFARRSGMK